MTKTAACFIFFICFTNLLYAQRPQVSQSVIKIYSAEKEALIAHDSLQPYLVEFKNPAQANRNNIRILKRVSYNYYIVSSPKALAANAEMLSARPSNQLYKADDNLARMHTYQPNTTAVINVLLKSAGNNTAIHQLRQIGRITSTNGNLVTLKTSLKNLPAILQLKEVSFATLDRKAHEELVINDINLGINNIAAVTGNYPDINGSGIKVSVKEERYDDQDLDLLGRSFTSVTPSSNYSGHATIMATLIGGNGNSFIKGLGAAPGVKFTSSNFERLLPDTLTAFTTGGISVQNHSYGTRIENYYGLEAEAYDRQVYEADTVVHVFSSGNIGDTAPVTGLYNGISNMANLSGTFKQAKNVLVVGGTGRTGIPESLSSAGPAYDGRVKPELVADGEDGTSGAAALASGTVALLQQAYQKQFKKLPPAALVKSVLINSTDDIGTPAVDYKTGYGKLNALEAVRTIAENRIKTGAVANKQQITYQLTVPANCRLLKVSLAWSDVPAQLNAPYALVNDLDLRIITPSGQTLLPWVLSAYPATDSLLKPAVRQRDTLNNTEQVTLQDAPAGVYTIQVSGSRVMQGPQNFYIAYSTALADQFEWTMPLSNNQLFAADGNYLHWQNTFTAAKGDLSVSYDQGNTWQPIATGLNLNDNGYQWTAPDVFIRAKLKMHTGNEDFISGAFTLSKPLTLQVGYNCTDGVLLHWNPQPGASGYTIYTIKDNLLQKLVTTADTSIIIPAQMQVSNYYAVSAQGNDFEGIKSFTIDVTTQGVGCYVKTLLADVTGNKSVTLTLTLGSVLNLSTITWEKLTGTNQYTTLGTTNITDSVLTYQFADASPKNGINYYRAKLITANGAQALSDLASATLLQNNQFALFPNPVGAQLNILAGELNTYELKLYNMTGMVSLTQNFNGLQNSISLNNLLPGTYISVISHNGKILCKGKVVKLP